MKETAVLSRLGDDQFTVGVAQVDGSVDLRAGDCRTLRAGPHEAGLAILAIDPQQTVVIPLQVVAQAVAPAKAQITGRVYETGALLARPFKRPGPVECAIAQPEPYFAGHH